jgi:hypothetical protein
VRNYGVDKVFDDPRGPRGPPDGASSPSFDGASSPPPAMPRKSSGPSRFDSAEFKKDIKACQGDMDAVGLLYTLNPIQHVHP